MDDIGFLKKKGNKESFLFFVDSASRDPKRYPQPNEYSIDFSSPFKNVYSLEVIDASIPRTQYAVDLHTNKLCYTYNELSYEIDIDIGDYTDQLLINELNTKFNANNTLITVHNLSSPASLRSTYIFKGAQKFVLNISDSTIGEILGFGNYGEYESLQDDKQYDYVSILDDYSSDNSYIFGISPNNILYQQLTSSDSGYVKQINMNFGFTHPVTLNVCIGYYEGNKFVQLPNSFKSISSINPNNDESISRYNVIYTDNSIYIVNTNIYFIKIYFTNIINENTVIYTSNHLTSNNINQLYFRENSTDSNANLLPITYINIYDQVNSIYHKDPLYISVFAINDPTDIKLSADMTVEMNIAIESITAPGMYSLIGDRYIILRCPEIEDHMFRSRAFEKYNMGLAKFKMAVLGYGQERFDYNGLPPRHFHPIGKLQRLSFRFEKADGTLYNFRGINHTITFLVKYMTPVQDQELTYSKLNPQYNPNFFQYMQNEKSDTEDSSDEEQSEYILEKPNRFFI